YDIRGSEVVIEDVPGMDVLGRHEAGRLPVGGAGADDRDFLAERDESFQDAGRPAHRVPGLGRLVPALDDDLALAVVAEVCRLQHRGDTDLGEGRGQLCRTAHRAIVRHRETVAT